MLTLARWTPAIIIGALLALSLKDAPAIIAATAFDASDGKAYEGEME